MVVALLAHNLIISLFVEITSFPCLCFAISQILAQLLRQTSFPVLALRDRFGTNVGILALAVPNII